MGDQAQRAAPCTPRAAPPAPDAPRGLQRARVTAHSCAWRHSGAPLASNKTTRRIEVCACGHGQGGGWDSAAVLEHWRSSAGAMALKQRAVPLSVPVVPPLPPPQSLLSLSEAQLWETRAAAEQQARGRPAAPEQAAAAAGAGREGCRRAARRGAVPGADGGGQRSGDPAALAAGRGDGRRCGVWSSPHGAAPACRHRILGGAADQGGRLTVCVCARALACAGAGCAGCRSATPAH